MKTQNQTDFPVVTTWTSVKKKDPDLYKAERWARAIYRACQDGVTEENIRNAERICGYKTQDIIWKIYALFPFWQYEKREEVKKFIKNTL